MCVACKKYVGDLEGMAKAACIAEHLDWISRNGSLRAAVQSEYSNRGDTTALSDWFFDHRASVLRQADEFSARMAAMVRQSHAKRRQTNP